MTNKILRLIVGVEAVAFAVCGLLRAEGPGGGGHAASVADEVVGVRFTPGMAKAIAHKMKPLLKRYEMPDDKQDEAADKIALRLMEAAHAMDGRAQELVERFMEEQLNRELEGGVSGNNGFVPAKFGREFADRMLELTPALKNFMRGFSQDLRPMLPFKQQLKFAGDMMAAKAGIDGFEQTMQKWSNGEIQDFDDPFRKERGIKKDESGQSEELRSARKATQDQLDKFAVSDWERYVKHFKKFYNLDEAQCSTVDSILREFKQRAEQRKRDRAWRERYYRNRTWMNIFWRVPNSWSHPVQILIQDDLEDATTWMESLSADFKSRLDTVPTMSQRRRAEERIEIAMKEKGITWEGGAK